MTSHHKSSRVAASTLICGRLGLSDAVAKIRKAGFRYVEIAAMHDGNHGRPADFVGHVSEVADDLATICAKAAITPISVTADTTGSPGEQIAQVRALAEVARATGMGVVTLMPAQLSTPLDEDIARFGRFMDVVSDLPVTLSLNTHVDTHSEDPRTALRYVKEVPGLGITLDPAHYLVGPHWNGAVRALFPFVRATQLKESGRRLEDIQLPVGQGVIDIPGLMADLVTAGYTGDWVIEYFDPAEDPPRFDYLAEAARLRELLEQAA